MLKINLNHISRLLPISAVLSLLLFTCCSYGAIPPPPPTVNVYTGDVDDPNDPDPGGTKTAQVSADVNNPPVPQAESTLVGHWTWTVGTVIVTPYDGSSDITADSNDFSVKLIPISDPGQPDDGKIDDTNPNAKFTGTFRFSGYYAIPVTATVHFVDKVTGADAGTYSNTDFIGSPEDNPAYDPTQVTSSASVAASAIAPNIAGNAPNAAPGIPATPVLPKRVVSGLFVGLPYPIKLGLYSKNHATETYIISVKPKFAVGDVTFTVANQVASAIPTPETTKNAKGQDVQTGNIKLVLTALVPSGAPSGNTYGSNSYKHQ